MSASARRFPDRWAEGDAAYVLVGPTAMGKTEVAQRIAVVHGLGILSADSMLVYRGMDIGTAKPTVAERGPVPYWGIDLVEPGELFSAGDYARHAATARNAARVTGSPLLITGGTGLYLSAILLGLRSGGPPSAAVRDRVRGWRLEGGMERLQEELTTRDPGRFARLADPKNPRRVMRALEQVLDGESSASNWGDWPRPRVAGLRMDRKRLDIRMADRVRRMYAAGFLDEVERLRSARGGFSVTAGKGIGYAEALEVVDGKLSERDAIARTVMRTRRLAKRQMTWFANQLDVSWVDVDEDMDIERVAERVVKVWNCIGATSLAAGGT